MDTNAEPSSAANREYKDSVFRALFSSDKKILIELYNALFGANYGADTNVIIRTLTSVFRGGVKNDLAFQLAGTMIILIEHQSTISPNMPLRMLYYIAETYSSMIEKMNVFRSTPVDLPFPIFVVLYIGDKPIEGGYMLLKLSDLFAQYGAECPLGGLELLVHVYDINQGRNPELAERSPTLAGYEAFVEVSRKYKKKMSDDEAIARTVQECIDKNILKDFFEQNKQEVAIMLKNEWNGNIVAEAAWEDGADAGRLEAMRKIARALLADGKTKEEVMKYTGLTIDDVLRLMN
jgi:hypothetical protein